MSVQTYASPQAFKQALEQRLKAASSSGVDFGRRRQLLVFDRFLARVMAIFGDAAVLKGGLVLELRLERARAKLQYRHAAPERTSRTTPYSLGWSVARTSAQGHA